MSNVGRQSFVVRGKTSYAKILGQPLSGYEDKGDEWRMDLEISREVAENLSSQGLGEKIKQKKDYLNGNPFLSFKHPAKRKDGSDNNPIDVVDKDGNPWDERTLIGNGSDVDVKFDAVFRKAPLKTGIYIRAVRVLKLVPYNPPPPFDPVEKDDPFYSDSSIEM